MSLRIGFDMDGVFADFSSAFHNVEVRLFGPDASSKPNDPEQEEAADARAAASGPGGAADGGPPSPRQSRRRRDAVWSAIRSTPDFWTTLQPLDPTAVQRLFDLTMRHRWEVFFMTQRPETQGETVQRQTQRWLAAHGFDLPTVMVLGGSRGAAAAALRLDYHVDDSPQHCVDIVSESRARPVLILPDQDQTTIAKARKLRIATARSVAECLDMLEEASLSRTQPHLLDRLATMVGWK